MNKEILNKKVIVFDMDGTLYQLDGENNGIRGSRLEKAVLEESKQFILDREGCPASVAEDLVDQGMRDSIGLSNFLANRYGIDRKEYFDAVWSRIRPGGIVQNFEEAVKIVKRLAESDRQLILLTSAPSAWQKQVVEFLKIDGCFNQVYTGEDFGQKDEIFETLSRRYDVNDILSVGDQERTDIEPAENLGMAVFLVRQPNDLIIFNKKENK